jgi:AbrB family looped-hinge helix DNA binding protein
MALVKLRRAAQITLPRTIRDAAGLEEGDYLDVEVTASGEIVLRPVNARRGEPTEEQQAEILAVVDEERRAYAADRRR